MKKQTITQNIEWNKLPAFAKVRDTGSSYVATLPDGTEALIFWGSEDARQAQKTLASLANTQPYVMQAIRTKYHGPTNTRGSRISATCEAGKVSIPYPYECNADEAHRKAALTLMDKLGWKEDLTQGGLDDGCVFVLTPRTGRDEARPRVTFDGKGLNAADEEYCPRIATFTSDEMAQKYGKVLATA